jgi:SAM-dependent methyltransferase
MLDLSLRADLHDLPELMDQPCTYAELTACLRDIARVNRLTFAHRPTLSWLEDVIALAPARPLHIVDVGCGYGDTLRRIHVWAAKRGVATTLTGIDLNPDAIRAAKAATPATHNIQWIQGNALSYSSPEGIDIVLSTLLTHHLANDEIVRFLGWMEETARCGWFINDLHRKAVPYHAFRMMAGLARWHPFVRHDGPVSIRRSFVAEDWERLCLAAHLPPSLVSIKEYKPARLCVGRIKLS